MLADFFYHLFFVIFTLKLLAERKGVERKGKRAACIRPKTTLSRGVVFDEPHLARSWGGGGAITETVAIVLYYNLHVAAVAA